MDIGRKIKQRRTELGWSLRELAFKMGYSNHSTVARIEAGEIDIPQSKIVKFADVLNVTIEYLMGWDYKEEPEELADYVVKLVSNSRVKHMVELYVELDESEQDLVDALVEKLKKKE